MGREPEQSQSRTTKLQNSIKMMDLFIMREKTTLNIIYNIALHVSVSLVIVDNDSLNQRGVDVGPGLVLARKGK